MEKELNKMISKQINRDPYSGGYLAPDYGGGVIGGRRKVRGKGLLGGVRGRGLVGGRRKVRGRGLVGGNPLFAAIPLGISALAQLISSIKGGRIKVSNVPMMHKNQILKLVGVKGGSRLTRALLSKAHQGLKAYREFEGLQPIKYKKDQKKDLDEFYDIELQNYLKKEEDKQEAVKKLYPKRVPINKKMLLKKLGYFTKRDEMKLNKKLGISKAERDIKKSIKVAENPKLQELLNFAEELKQQNAGGNLIKMKGGNDMMGCGRRKMYGGAKQISAAQKAGLQKGRAITVLKRRFMMEGRSPAQALQMAQNEYANAMG